MMTKNLLLLFTFLILSITATKASHIPGGNITYRCLGSNTFVVRLTLFEDCGSSFESLGSKTVTATNTCGFPNQTMVLPNIVFQQEVSQLCPADALNSECYGGSLPGVYMHIYEDTVVLSGVCDTWTFYFSLCCRNASTNASSSSASLYVETTLNSVTAVCNNSATITAQPIPYVCAGQPVSYSLSAIDPDGDSLVYSLVNALTAAGSPITYFGGYSGAVPIPGMTIDPSTGLLNFTTGIIGNYIVAIKITEYAAGTSNITGTITQDFQFEVISCTNIVPEPPASLTDLVGTTYVDPNSINLCSGQAACFDLVFTDDDSLQNLTMDTAFSIFPPGTSYTVSGTNPMTVNVCIVATPGLAAFSVVSIAVADDACPISGFANYAVSIGISESAIPMSILQEVNPPCNGVNTGLIEVEAGTGIPVTFQWYLASDTINPIMIDSLSNPSTLDSLGPGSYLVYFYDTAGCINYEYIDLTGTVPHFINTSFTNTACPGVSSGSLSAEGTNGISPWDYYWSSTGVGADTLQFYIDVMGINTATGLPEGTYSLSIVDSNGCSNDTLLSIGVNSEPVITINSVIDAACSGIASGAVTVTASVGTGPWDYVWTDSGGGPIQISADIAGSNTADTLLSGTYTITVFDALGCTTDTTVFVDENPPPVITGIVITPSACPEVSTGTITGGVVPASGFAPWDFVWATVGPPPVTVQSTLNIPGTTSSVDSLSPGTYTLTVTDVYGCTSTTTITVGAGSVNGSGVATPEICYDFDNGTVNITHLSGGDGPYIYVLTDDLGNPLDTNSTGIFTPVATGDYIGFVVDVNGCYDSLSALTVDQAVFLDAVFTATPNEGTPPLTVEIYNNSVNDLGSVWYLENDDVDGNDTLLNPGDYFTNTYVNEGYYEITLVVFDINGCTDTARLYIQTNLSSMIFPNVFSPGNGNELNNFFGFNTKKIVSLNCQIFDRWGKLVFESTDPLMQWDGKYKGKEVSDGVYFYSVKATGVDDKAYEHHGELHIFRK